MKDSKDLAQKINRLAHDEDLREVMGKNSRMKAIEEFDINIIVKKYMEVYEKSI